MDAASRHREDIVRLFAILGDLLGEGIRLPNYRKLPLLASWTKDADKKSIPELRLNVLLMLEAFLQLFAKGFGTLALLWATVVLLGGFSAMLGKMDFWFTTAIVFIEAAGIVGYNGQPGSRFFVDFPSVFPVLDTSALKIIIAVILRLLAAGPVFLAAAPIIAAFVCITLSIIRLLYITSHHHYGGSGDGNSGGNVKPALILFYSLVLIQGISYVGWLVSVFFRQIIFEAAVKDQFRSDSEESKLVERYVTNILDTCVGKGVLSIANRNLVSFAADLLQSEHSADHVSAVTLLHALILHEKRTAGALKQIRSSQQFVDRLVQMLSPVSSIDGRHKKYTAEIVARLASHLRLADIPGSSRIISSLIDATLINVQTEHGTFHGSTNNKPLIVHGLLILAEFAGDPDNCAEISNTTALVGKITAPVTHGMHTASGNEYDRTSIEIVKASLAVIAKLVNGRDKASKDVAQEIVTTSDSGTVDNIIWILKNSSSDAEMKIVAIQILTKLTLDETRMHRFITELRRLFFDSTEESSLGLAAGQAQAALLVKHHPHYEMVIGEQVGRDYPVIQQLVTVMCSDPKPEEYKAAAAESLAQICANSTAQDRNHLAPISSALPMVLKAIAVDVVIQQPEVQIPNELLSLLGDDAELRRRKFLGSLLGLAMHICNKLTITADVFDAAVAGIPLQMDDFVRTLKRIVQETSKYPEEVHCLVIIRNTSKLATWMMQHIPGYITLFRQDILTELKSAANAMVALERYMILSGNADKEASYETLSALVGEVEALISTSG